MRWEHVSAYVVVFSVEDRSSFRAAIDWLYEIRRDTVVDHHPAATVSHLRPAVILVANKVDLVRNRAVLEQGTFDLDFYFLLSILRVLLILSRLFTATISVFFVPCCPVLLSFYFVLSYMLERNKWKWRWRYMDRATIT